MTETLDKDHPVVFDNLEGDFEFAGDLVGVALVHGFGARHANGSTSFNAVSRLMQCPTPVP